MTTTIGQLSAFLNEKINISAFPADVSNNGLQFEGSGVVTRAVFGVDASAALFSAAADADADFVFTHHGISWGGSLRRIRGVDSTRVSILAANGISLYAAHLPLDANPEFGHNILMANLLKLKDPKPFALYNGYKIGFYGALPRQTSIAAIADIFNENLPSEGDLSILGDEKLKVKNIGIVSGGGASPDFFNEMKDLGVECLITGECGHMTYHYALETGIPVIAMGHYRSEIPGVLAVKELVENAFPDISCAFIDIPTGY